LKTGGRHTVEPAMRVAVLALFVLALAPAIAHADNVTDLIKQLRGGSDYKVRLSAAIGLGNQKDSRAITPLVTALEKDGDKNVRAAAAASLGKIINAKTKETTRTTVVAALDKAAQKDSSSLVKSQAQKAAAAIKALSATTTQAIASGTYVDIGPMGSKVPDTQKLKDLMRKTAMNWIPKTSKDLVTTGTPAKGAVSFHVDGTLTELTQKEKGATTLVSCKINMLIATYPEKSMFGFLNGGATVQSSSKASDVEFAKEDCVAAVVEDLVVKKIVPTIKIKAGK
jgi:hypothetical protein